MKKHILLTLLVALTFGSMNYVKPGNSDNEMPPLPFNPTPRRMKFKINKGTLLLGGLGVGAVAYLGAMVAGITTFAICSKKLKKNSGKISRLAKDIERVRSLKRRNSEGNLNFDEREELQELTRKIRRETGISSITASSLDTMTKRMTQNAKNHKIGKILGGIVGFGMLGVLGVATLIVTHGAAFITGFWLAAEGSPSGFVNKQMGSMISKYKYSNEKTGF